MHITETTEGLEQTCSVLSTARVKNVNLPCILTSCLFHRGGGMEFWGRNCSSSRKVNPKTVGVWIVAATWNAGHSSFCRINDKMFRLTYKLTQSRKSWSHAFRRNSIKFGHHYPKVCFVARYLFRNICTVKSVPQALVRPVLSRLVAKYPSITLGYLLPVICFGVYCRVCDMLSPPNIKSSSNCHYLLRVFFSPFN